jgi:DNA-binding MarR family transcriptional regulator
MSKQGLVDLTPGEDARHRIVGLTPKAGRILSTVQAEWTATAAAAEALEAELSFPLSQLIDEALDALRRQPMRRRIAAAAPDLLMGYEVSG